MKIIFPFILFYYKIENLDLYYSNKFAFTLKNKKYFIKIKNKT